MTAIHRDELQQLVESIAANATERLTKVVHDEVTASATAVLLKKLEGGWDLPHRGSKWADTFLDDTEVAPFCGAFEKPGEMLRVRPGFKRNGVQRFGDDPDASIVIVSSLTEEDEIDDTIPKSAWTEPVTELPWEPENRPISSAGYGHAVSQCSKVTAGNDEVCQKSSRSAWIMQRSGSAKSRLGTTQLHSIQDLELELSLNIAGSGIQQETSRRRQTDKNKMGRFSYVNRMNLQKTAHNGIGSDMITPSVEILFPLLTCWYALFGILEWSQSKMLSWLQRILLIALLACSIYLHNVLELQEGMGVQLGQTTSVAVAVGNLGLLFAMFCSRRFQGLMDDDAVLTAMLSSSHTGVLDVKSKARRMWIVTLLFTFAGVLLHPVMYSLLWNPMREGRSVKDLPTLGYNGWIAMSCTLLTYIVSSCCSGAIVCYILHLCAVMSELIDNFCVRFYTDRLWDDAFEQWNSLSSGIRYTSEAMSLCIVVLVSEVLIVGFLVGSDVYLTDGPPLITDMPRLVFALGPVLCAMMSAVLILLRAANVSWKCSRVVPFINSLSGGHHSDRQTLLDFVSRSEAGFYMSDNRLNPGIVFKGLYMCCLVFGTVLVRLAGSV